MRAESANPNHRAAPLSSRAAVSLSWYDSISTPTLTYAYTLTHEHTHTHTHTHVHNMHNIYTYINLYNITIHYLYQ